jgi:hypothetical protein
LGKWTKQHRSFTKHFLKVYIIAESIDPPTTRSRSDGTLAFWAGLTVGWILWGL